MLDVIRHPIFICVAAVFVLSVAFLLVTYLTAAHFVYTKTLKRSSKDQWTRDVPSELTEEAVQMYKEGLAWATERAQYKRDVHIVNDGLNLYGEYYDFGYDKAVFILSGRTEALRYGYYFALPYSQSGFNVLVVDPRAHGLSDGVYNTVGFEESKDILAWSRFLKEECKVKSLIYHGICIGAAGGMYAITSQDCPDIVKGIVTEGMFANFSESMKNHLIEKKKPVFILNDLIDAKMKRCTGHSMKYGPINVINKLDKPLLMLQGKKDLYSKPELAKKLYDTASSQNKTLVYFDEGAHSMLRITDTKRYDTAIKEYLNSLKL